MVLTMLTNKQTKLHFCDLESLTECVFCSLLISEFSDRNKKKKKKIGAPVEGQSSLHCATSRCQVGYHGSFLSVTTWFKKGYSEIFGQRQKQI